MIKKSKEYYKRLKQALKEQDWKCTFWPDFNKVLKSCCKVHDYDCADARAMQSEKERLITDIELRNCGNKSFPLMGEIMFSGIRGFLNTRRILFKKPMY